MVQFFFLPCPSYDLQMIIHELIFTTWFKILCRDNSTGENFHFVHQLIEHRHRHTATVSHARPSTAAKGLAWGPAIIEGLAQGPTTTGRLAQGRERPRGCRAPHLREDFFFPFSIRLWEAARGLVTAKRLTPTWGFFFSFYKF